MSTARKIGRGMELGMALAVLLWAYECVPPWPFVTEDGTPAKLRDLGMRRCPGCGHMSNETHRRLCKGELTP